MNADVGEELQRIHLSAVGFRSESGTLTQSSSLDNLFLLDLLGITANLVDLRPALNNYFLTMVLAVARPYVTTSYLTASTTHHHQRLTTSIVSCPPHRRAWTPPKATALKGLFSGSGNAGMSHPYFAQSVVDLTKRSAKECNLLYIGTASYDIPKYRDIQTEAFIGLGCTVQSLDVANGLPLTFDMEEAVEKAHIILVSGGNTLFAVDTWKLLGLDELLKSAAHRGTVMTGGSAGCICWFDGGHSDR